MSKKTQEAVPLHVFQGTKMEQLKQLHDQWYACKRCVLSTFRIDGHGKPFEDITFADGNPDAKVMIVGEAPGAEEEVCSIPFVGPSGRLLDQILAATSDDPGIQELFRWYNHGRHSQADQNHFHEKMLEWRQREFFISNVVACRPPENRAPTHPEVKACWERLLNIIYIVDPWLIITMGRSAIETLLHKQIEITKLRGSIFDVEFPGHRVPFRIPVMACLHPSYLLRMADWKSKTGTFMKTVRDIHTALRLVDGLKAYHLGIPIPNRSEIPK